VQRALAAKNMLHAKMGCIIASLLKFLPFFFLVLPGMVARVLYRGLSIKIHFLGLFKTTFILFDSKMRSPVRIPVNVNGYVVVRLAALI
jgi:hypothetical protein